MYKAGKFVLGTATLLVLVCVFFACYSYQHRSRSQVLQLSQPYGAITLSPSFSGEIGYLSAASSRNQRRNFGYDLILCQANPTPQNRVRVHQTVLHRFVTDPSYGITGCDFSPDEKNVLAKFSAPSVPTDVYSFCVWHKATGTVQQGPQGLRYVPTFWSPDSKFLAYIRGGDTDGREILDQGDQNQDAPLQLRIFDTFTGTGRLVAEHPLLDNIAWMRPDVLLYSKTVQPVPLLFDMPNQASQPNIFAYSLRTGTSKLLIGSGFSPAASPDAKNIAFLGWGPAAPQTSSSTAFGIYLYNLHKKTQALVCPLPAAGERDQLLWMPDNKNLLVLRVLSHGTNLEAHLVRVDTLSRATRQLALLTVSNAKPRTHPAAAFQWKGFSESGNAVFIATDEISREVNTQTGQSITHDSLYSISLSDGAKHTLYTGTNLTLLGWHR